MRWYRDLSITTKLSLLVLLAGGVALLLATACFVWNDVTMIRESMVKQISIAADVLGSDSTAALSFQDNDRATELLRSLEQEPAVDFACIYNSAGQPFATYYRKGVKMPAPPVPKTAGARFVDGGYLDVAEIIDQRGQPIGIIFLRANLSEVNAQLWRYAAIVAGMLSISLGSSILLSRRFQRLIAVPLVNLAEAAKRVRSERNYGIRVVKTADDELGELYDQFNAMLEQIQRAEAAIQAAKDQLEIKVKERTAELSLTNESLSREMSVRESAERELEATHQKLLETARRAGMAEIATGVLHNVGNVLNSINVSATLVQDRIRQSKIADLVRATQLMDRHANDLGTFITADPKGKQLPIFFRLLANHLSDERADIAKELELAHR